MHPCIHVAVEPRPYTPLILFGREAMRIALWKDKMTNKTLKQLGLPMLALAAVMMFAGAPKANAQVDSRFHRYGYPFAYNPYYYPYYQPYYYPYGYGYSYPYYYGGRFFGGHDRDDRGRLDRGRFGRGFGGGFHGNAFRGGGGFHGGVGRRR